MRLRSTSCFAGLPEAESVEVTSDFAPFVCSADAHVDAVSSLFREYAASIVIYLCFQSFDEELLNLPGEYAAPRGALLVARVGERFAGCCALRPLDAVDYANACEMKRLYVRPDCRGTGVGRLLAEAILAHARLAGYG